jgi:hypothetical protein
MHACMHAMQECIVIHIYRANCGTRHTFYSANKYKTATRMCEKATTLKQERATTRMRARSTTRMRERATSLMRERAPRFGCAPQPALFGMRGSTARLRQTAVAGAAPQRHGSGTARPWHLKAPRFDVQRPDRGTARPRHGKTVCSARPLWPVPCPAAKGRHDSDAGDGGKRLGYSKTRVRPRQQAARAAARHGSECRTQHGSTCRTFGGKLGKQQRALIRRRRRRSP